MFQTCCSSCFTRRLPGQPVPHHTAPLQAVGNRDLRAFAAVQKRTVHQLLRCAAGGRLRVRAAALRCHSSLGLCRRCRHVTPALSCTPSNLSSCVSREAVIAARGSKSVEWECVKEGSQMQLAGWCAVQHEWCACTCQSRNHFRFLTLSDRAGFAACVLARSGRSGSLGQAMRDFCVRGDARALLKQLDKGRQPQHAVASVLVRKGWADVAAATSEVQRSYVVLAVNTLQVHTCNSLPIFSSLRSPAFALSERSIQPPCCTSHFPWPRSPSLAKLLKYRAASHMILRAQVLPDDLVRLPDGTVGTASTDALRYTLDDVLLPLIGTKTLLPAYATSCFTSNPPDAAIAALAAPPSDSDINVSSATKKSIAQPGS
jgi:hypothetical protein